MPVFGAHHFVCALVICGGWNAIVAPRLVRLNVARDSTTHVIVTLPVVPTYDISAPETISVAIPAEAVSSGQVLQAGTFVVQANAGAVEMLPKSGTREEAEAALVQEAEAM